MPGRLRLPAVILTALLFASASSAQWTPVAEVPGTAVYSVWANGDTIAAGADTVAFVSTDAGASWKRTAKPVDGVTSLEAVRVRNGLLYAGTLGQGVFVSDDLGDSWAPFSQGLAGGIGGSHLHIIDLLVRGDSLFAATSGAGPWVRNLAGAGTWTRFGDALEQNQAANMNAIAAGGSRLLAAAGFNGTVFFRDPGQPDWTLSWLDGGIVPGLAALSATWTGSAWVVGTNVGFFRSPQGQSPWTFVDPGLGTLFGVSFARSGAALFASLQSGSSSVIERSVDHGESWQPLESLPGTFTFGLAASGDALLAARFDGLWRRPLADLSVPPAAGTTLRLAVAGTQPVRDELRLRFELPAAGDATLEVFDLAGRRAAPPLGGRWPAGPQEVAVSARSLAPGVYAVRLRSPHGVASVRFVRLR